MKTVLAVIAVLALTGCATSQEVAPSTTAKVVVGTKAGLKAYCQLPFDERKAARCSLNTDKLGVAVWCNDAERKVLAGLELQHSCEGSYIKELEK